MRLGGFCALSITLAKQCQRHRNKAKLASKIADEYTAAQNLPPSLAAQAGPRGKKTRKADGAEAGEGE